MDKLSHDFTGASAMTADHPTPKNVRPARHRAFCCLPVFCPDDGTDRSPRLSGKLRTAAIKGEGGEVLFEQHDCEIPADWTQLATNVVATSIFTGRWPRWNAEKGVRQLVHRVCRTIADWGIADAILPAGRRRAILPRTLLAVSAPMRVVQFAGLVQCGLVTTSTASRERCANWHWDKAAGEAIQPENPYEFPQASACFIQSVQDNMEDIMELARSEAMLFKFGSGTGTDLSTLRSHREELSGGGKPSGPLSFHARVRPDCGGG